MVEALTAAVEASAGRFAARTEAAMEIRPDHIEPRLGVADRRRIPDRRAVWRGGRRDSDWEHRPVDAPVWTMERPARHAWLARLGVVRALARGLRLAPLPFSRS